MGVPFFSPWPYTLRREGGELPHHLRAQEPPWSALPPLKVFKFSLSPHFHRRKVSLAIGILKVIAFLMFPGFAFALVFREEPKTR